MASTLNEISTKTSNSTSASTTTSANDITLMKEHNCNDNNEVLLQQLRQKCNKTAQSYQKKFRHIKAISSEEFIHNYIHDNDNKKDFILIDVRTKAERDVSIIQGAISLKEFYQKYNNSTNGNNNSNGNIPDVFTYCTIGYRSGMEATRIQYQYPHLQVYNLDGIVAFALQQYNNNNNNNNNTCNKLVNPYTGETVTTVHTFGFLWDFCSNAYETKHFHIILELPFRLIQVGAKSVLRTTQYLFHSCLLPRRRNVEKFE